MHELLTGKNIEVFDKSKVSEGDVVKVTFYWKKEVKRTFWKRNPLPITGDFMAYGIVEAVSEDYVKVVTSLDREKLRLYQNNLDYSYGYRTYVNEEQERVILFHKDKLGINYDIEVALKL